MNFEQDEQVYRRFLKKRDESDLRVLLERYKEKLTLFLFGFVNDPDDAEDLMMETFAVVASKDRWSEKGSSFKTWLYAIGRNQALMHLRKRRFPTSVLEEIPSEKAELPELNILRQEQYRELYAAMEKLNPDYRQVLMLIYFEDMSHEEAAKVMGKSRKQVYNLAGRGKERLKQILSEAGFEYAKY